MCTGKEGETQPEPVIMNICFEHIWRFVLHKIQDRQVTERAVRRPESDNKHAVFVHFKRSNATATLEKPSHARLQVL